MTNVLGSTEGTDRHIVTLSTVLTPGENSGQNHSADCGNGVCTELAFSDVPSHSCIHLHSICKLDGIVGTFYDKRAYAKS